MWIDRSTLVDIKQQEVSEANIQGGSKKLLLTTKESIVYSISQ